MSCRHWTFQNERIRMYTTSIQSLLDILPHWIHSNIRYIVRDRALIFNIYIFEVNISLKNVIVGGDQMIILIYASNEFLNRPNISFPPAHASFAHCIYKRGMVGVLYGMNVFLQQTTAVRLKYYSHFFNGTKQCFSKLEQNDKYASAYSEHKVIIHYNMQILLFIAKSSNEHRLCALS